ncbi:MAG TPA: protein kinase, partial [Myxococcota bacterium]|nr:protein kinase [Myxococcota bacterium]
MRSPAPPPPRALAPLPAPSAPLAFAAGLGPPTPDGLTPRTNARKTKLGTFFVGQGRLLRFARLKGRHGGRTYWVSQTLVKGGYGKVRLAVDAAGNEYAVKELRLETARHRRKYDPDTGAVLPPKTKITKFDNLVRERDMLLRVGSPLRFSDFLNVDGKIYGIMPRMDGDLSRLGDAVLQRPQGLSEEHRRALSLYILEKVSADLAVTHARGVIHHDVKMDNMLWRRDGTVSLQDFGLAKETREDGTVEGGGRTRGYLAPERLGDDVHDNKVDLWALGVALCDLWRDAMDRPPLLRLREHLPEGEGERRVRETVGDLVAYRNAVVAAGPVTLEALREHGHGPFAVTFERIARSSPELCDFILRELLCPEPQDRASAARAEAFATAHLDADTRQRVVRFFARRGAENRHHNEVLMALQGLRWT